MFSHSIVECVIYRNRNVCCLSNNVNSFGIIVTLLLAFLGFKASQLGPSDCLIINFCNRSLPNRCFTLSASFSFFLLKMICSFSQSVDLALYYCMWAYHLPSFTATQKTQPSLIMSMDLYLHALQLPIIANRTKGGQKTTTKKNKSTDVKTMNKVHLVRIQTNIFSNIVI